MVMQLTEYRNTADPSARSVEVVASDGVLFTHMLATKSLVGSPNRGAGTGTPRIFRGGEW